MGTITIYGASDDLIEFEGDFCDEGNHYGDDPTFIHLDDGSVVKAIYDQDGIWRLDPVKLATGTVVAEHEQGDVEADTPDRLTLTSNIHKKFKRFDLWDSADGPRLGELCEAIERWFDNHGVSNLDTAQATAIWALLNK